MTDADAFTDRRKVIDRAALSQALDDLAKDHASDSPALRDAVLQLFKDALATGHAEVRQRFKAGGRGNMVLAANCYLLDQLIRALYNFTTAPPIPPHPNASG